MDAETPQGRAPETTDRLLVGVCGAIWLVLLVVSAIATVALVQLGRGRGGEAADSRWLLYTVIAVSALTILGSIPLLLKARRAALDADSVEVAPPPPPRPARPVAEAPTEKLRVFGTAVDAHPAPPPREDAAGARLGEVRDRVWLRGATSVLSAMGLALIGVATATYLFAVGSDTAAWAALGVAGALTAAMPAVAVVFGRQLDALA